MKAGRFPFSVLGRAGSRRSEGFVKIVGDKYDEVLGVHIIGPQATELIAEACSPWLECTPRSSPA